jgi:hypothetical protein
VKVGKLLHKIVLLRPLLKLLGVKDKTVAAKVGEGLSIVDKAVNEKGDEGVVLLFILLLIVIFYSVMYMVADAIGL